MKLRKILTAVACFVFVLVGALGFAGCAHTSNVDAQEALAYVQEANVAETIANGYKVKVSMMGDDAEAIILLGEHPQAYMKSEEGEIWYKDEYVYMNDGTRKVKINFALDGDVSDIPQEYHDYVESVQDALTGNSSDMFDLEEYMDYIAQALENETLKTTKTVDGKKVTYTFKGGIHTQILNMDYSLAFTFTDAKFTAVAFSTGSGQYAMSMKVAPYAGTIKFPNFSAYEEVDIAH